MPATDARIHRFHVPELGPGRIDLDAGEAHHALHVLRVRPGQSVELFDGRGHSAPATVARTRRREVTVDAAQPDMTQPPARPAVRLAFAVPKGKRLDWLLEKAGELAVATLQPVRFERSVAGGDLSATKRDKWLAHCISACKQSGCNWLPQLADPVDLAGLLADPGDGAMLVGDLGGNAQSLAEVWSQAGKPEECTVVVGPEGGLAEPERDALAESGFASVRLGATVLRTETACVAMVAALRALAD